MVAGKLMILSRLESRSHRDGWLESRSHRDGWLESRSHRDIFLK